MVACCPPYASVTHVRLRPPAWEGRKDGQPESCKSAFLDPFRRCLLSYCGLLQTVRRLPYIKLASDHICDHPSPVLLEKHYLTAGIGDCGGDLCVGAIQVLGQWRLVPALVAEDNKSS